MTTSQKAQYLTRSEILEALSDDEVKAVATAETAEALRDGEPYLDLTHLEQGVRHAGKGRAVRVGRVLPKGAVHEDTWRKIVALLPQAKSPAAARSLGRPHMRALVYGGPGKRAWAEKPTPKLEASTDAIVRVVRTTICGTDLHILRGDVPSVAEGRTLGHEGVGVIEDVGDAVSGFHVGDHVIISCITSCGRCDFCRRSMYSRCRHGGWILGNVIDGTQAERVRIPFADTSLHHVPKGADEDVLVMLSDILPTGFECGVLNGGVKPGDTVAIVGAGPIGLASLMTALMLSPASVVVIDIDDHRLALAKALGAAHVVNGADGGAAEAVLALTAGEGVDVAIEAVGTPATFDVCQQILGAGGHLANVGVHGKSVSLALEKLWDRNVTITTGLVDTRTTPLLLRMVTSGKLDATQLVSHRLGLGELMRAYDLFGDAASEKVLKIVLEAD